MLDDNEKLCILLLDHNHEPIVDQSNKIDVTEFLSYKTTNRGGQCLYMNNYKYVHCSEKKGKTQYRCCNYTRKCRVRITIQDGKAFMTGDHNHDWNKIMN